MGRLEEQLVSNSSLTQLNGLISELIEQKRRASNDTRADMNAMAVLQLSNRLEKYNLGGLSERIGQLDTSVTKAMEQAVAQNVDEKNKTAEAVDRLTKRLEECNLNGLDERMGQLDAAIADVVKRAAAQHSEQAATAQTSHEKIVLSMKLMDKLSTLLRAVSV